MNKSETSLGHRYLYKLIANIISAIVGIIIMGIVPSSLGPVAYGKFTYIQQFFSQLFNFLDFGTSIAFFTKLSANAKRKELIYFYMIISIMILFISLIIIYIINYFGYLNNFLPNIQLTYVYYGLIFGFLTWFSLIYIKISDAYALTVNVEVLKIVYKVLSLILLFLIIKLYILTLNNFLIFQICTLLLFIIVLNIFLIKKGILSNIHKLDISFSRLISIFYEFLIYSRPLAFHSIVVFIIGILDIWLLQSISGSSEMGIYGLAFQISTLGFIFTNAMIPIITREFSLDYEKKNFIKINKNFHKYIPMLFSLATIFTMLTIFQSKNLILLFTDERFLNAQSSIIIMSIYFIYLMYIKLISSIFFAYSKTIMYRDIGLLYMAIGIVFSLGFVYIFKLGALGLSIKMLITNIIGMLLMLFNLKKILNINILYLIKQQVLSMLTFLLIGIVTYFIVFSIDNIVMNFLVYCILYISISTIVILKYPSLLSLEKYEIKEFIIKVKAKFNV